MQLRFLLSLILLASWGILSPMATYAEYMERPLLVGCLAGIERVDADLQHLSNLAGDEELLVKFQSLHKIATQFIEIETSLPISLGLYLHQSQVKAMPAVVVIIPLVEPEQFEKNLKEKLPGLKDTGTQQWQIDFPKLRVHLKLKGDHLILTQAVEVLSRINPTDVQTWTNLRPDDDLTVSLNLSGLSPVVREHMQQKIKKDLHKELEQKPEEPDVEYRLRMRLIQLIESSVISLIDETESVTASIKLHTEFSAQVEWKASQGSNLATSLKNLSLQNPPALATFPTEKPFQLHFAFHLPELLKEFLADFFSTAREQIRRELSPKLAKEDRGPVAGAFVAIRETISAGIVNGLIGFEQTNSEEMVLIAGLAVSRNDLLATSLRTILPYAQQSEDIQNVEMDVINEDNFAVHQLTGHHQREDDRRLYGPDASLYVGTNNNAFWLANGGPRTVPALQNWTRQKTPRQRSLAEFQFSLTPWLKLAEKHGQDAKKVRFARQAFPDESQDRLTARIAPAEQGLKAELFAEKGYIHLFALLLNEN